VAYDLGKGYQNRWLNVPNNCKNGNLHLSWAFVEAAHHTILYYHCPDCGQTASPYDLASGLGFEQVSQALSKACCVLAVDDIANIITSTRRQRIKMFLDIRYLEQVIVFGAA